MKAALTWLVLLIAAAGVAAPAPHAPLDVRRGSLVIAIVSQQGDYVVMAAESRKSTQSGKPIDNKSCKVITLGGDTLFFEAGTPFIAVGNGEGWDAWAMARAVYARAKKRDALSLSRKWGDAALRWFQAQSVANLKSVSDENGGIVTGGFANFKETGSPPVRTQAITFSGTAHSVSRGEAAEPPAPGGVLHAGVADAQMKEFFLSYTERVRQVFASLGLNRNIGSDATMDATVAASAIRFAMDNTTGEEKGEIGGPIDVAILRRGGAVQWVHRKDDCYQQDLAK